MREDSVQELVNIFLSTLQFKYQHAWVFVLPALSSMIRVMGPRFPSLFVPVIQQLVAIYDASSQGDAAFAL